jgi:hypothetical protein
VEAFIGTSYAENTAALTVMRALVPAEVTTARIGRELAARRQPMPDWLIGLARTHVEPEVWLLTEVLGDGDDSSQRRRSAPSLRVDGSMDDRPADRRAACRSDAGSEA